MAQNGNTANATAVQVPPNQSDAYLVYPRKDQYFLGLNRTTGIRLALAARGLPLASGLTPAAYRFFSRLSGTVRVPGTLLRTVLATMLADVTARKRSSPSCENETKI